MKTLSQFLAEQLIDENDYYNDDAAYKEMVKWYANEIHTRMEKYKEHLQKDCPKTVHWAMIEKQIVEALTKAEQMPATPKDKEICAFPEFRMNAGCAGCSVMNCNIKLVAGPFTQDNLEELSANAASANKKKVAYPICPLNMYYEGDEDKCDADKCNFDTKTRMCREGCKIKG